MVTQATTQINGIDIEVPPNSITARMRLQTQTGVVHLELDDDQLVRLVRGSKEAANQIIRNLQGRLNHRNHQNVTEGVASVQ